MAVVVVVVPDAVLLATLRQNVVLPAAGSPQQDTSTAPHGLILPKQNVNARRSQLGQIMIEIIYSRSSSAVVRDCAGYA